MHEAIDKTYDKTYKKKLREFNEPKRCQEHSHPFVLRSFLLGETLTLYLKGPLCWNQILAGIFEAHFKSKLCYVQLCNILRQWDASPIETGYPNEKITPLSFQSLNLSELNWVSGCK